MFVRTISGFSLPGGPAAWKSTIWYAANVAPGIHGDSDRTERPSEDLTTCTFAPTRMYTEPAR